MTRRTGITAAALAAGMAIASAGWSARTPPARPTSLIVEGPFVETMVERGTVTAARLLLYGSTIAGAQAKLVEIVPEGTAVAPGDVLLRFDPAPFEEASRREEAVLAQADAEVIRAREDLRLEEMRAEAEVETAREQATAAESALASERDGRGPLQIAEAEVAANDAAREAARTRAAHEDMRALLERGFVTRLEADRAAEALQQAEDRLRLAALRLKTLQAYDRPAAEDRSRAGVLTAFKGLENAVAGGRARLAQRRAAVALAESRAAESRQRLERAREQAARTVVRADTGGLVIYRELFFGADRRKPQPGDEVWPSQPLLAIPDPGQLVVETRVRETDLHRITASQRVFVSVEAYPGLRLPASVAMVGAVALSDPARAGVRYFPVTVRLHEPDARLRTGMTARVEVETASRPRALLVPLESLAEDAGVWRVYVATRHGIEPRVVQVLARNDVVAAVSGGVAAGERALVLDATHPPAR